MKFRGAVVGDRALVQRMNRIVPAMRAELHATIERLTIKAVRKVKAGKLSGQVLNVRSGRLRRSINQRVVQHGDRIDGYIGTNVEYAGAHEYGFTGMVSVRAHLRKAKSRDASGVVATSEGKRRTAIKFGKTQSGIAFVAAHSRKMNMPMRSFLRSTLEEMRGEINREIHRVAVKVAKETR